ncbi:hemolysin family protein [Natronogracilivirga saccharolytica]|uniref:hemolysin family protein n=1 Tax=Natronogracilivirga saccharolytica TaxID=2812953 RepID=UPI001FEBD9BE|nr:hemolysin family protein [Natronogracilivirga saccharolytica]
MDFLLPYYILLSDSRLFAAAEGSTFDTLLTNPVDFVVLITVIILGLIFSAFFSGSEVAFFSLDKKVDRETIEEAKKDAALGRVLYMLDKPRQLLATILIGNTFANIITAVGAAVLTGRLVAFIGLPQVVVFAVEIMVLTFAIVILAEITPKLLALNKPMMVSRKLSALLYVFFVLFAPLSRFISFATRFLEKNVPRPTDNISSDDLKTIAEVGELHGSIHGDEREIIENVIEFGNTYVREIMTSRVNISAISTENTLQEVLDLIREKSISRLPLYEQHLDNIIGIIHSKDLLPYINTDLGQTTINWRTLARKALFIPTTKKLDDLLRDFQKEKTHIAIVVDEYGGTEGVITLDDVLEEIIGEITDEYTEPVELFTRKKSGNYIFDAKIDLDDMADILSMDLTTDEDEYETLGGLIYHLLERIPEEGESIEFKGMELTVNEMDNNRLSKVEVKVLDEGNSKDDGEETV